MSEWKETILDEFVDSISETFKFNSEPVVFLNTSDILAGKVLHHDASDPNTLPGQAKKRIKKGDFLFSEIRPINKRYARVTFDAENYVVSTKLMVLRSKGEIEPIYLEYFLTSDETLEYLQMIAEDRSGTFPQITFDIIKRLEISLPPLEEQRAIASILSSLDDKIDLLHRQNATLEKMAETLFRHWFVEEAKEEWDEINFGEFVTPKKGKNITKSEVVEGSYPVVAGGLEPSCYHIEANTKSPVITISASGANAGYIRLYTTPVWSSDSSYIDESITPYVYFCYVFLKINQSKLTDKQEGSAQPHIYPSHIMELDFMSYPESIIKVFEESARPLFNKIKSNQTQIRTLTALRDTLLPKLMSGEVRVEPD